jgi:hypothetical protein
MQTLQLRSQAGDDGVLHVKIPVGIPHAEYQVVVVLQPAAAEPGAKTPEELGWPPGFFEEVIGSWQGEFVRDQGEFEKREEL